MNRNPMTNQDFQRKNQQGSIIIWILVAIVLFAALSFIMSQGFRSGQGQLTQEKARLAATEIVAYAEQLRRAFKILQINGIPLENVSLEMDLGKGQDGTPFPYYLANANCTSNACRIFKPEGGGVTEQHFWQYAIADSWWGSNWAHVGGVEVMMLDVKSVGTTKPDIVMKINQLDRNICKEINKMIGISADARIWPTTTAFYPAIPANYNVTDAMNAGYNADAEYAGKMMFCDNEDRITYFVLQAQ